MKTVEHGCRIEEGIPLRALEAMRRMAEEADWPELDEEEGK